MENVMKLIQNNASCTPSQISMLSIDQTIGDASFDAMSFCQKVHLDPNSNFLYTGRLSLVARELDEMMLENPNVFASCQSTEDVFKMAVQYTKARAMEGGRLR